MLSNSLAARDIQHVVHPFTSLATHEKRGATFLAEGKGVYLKDAEGRWLIDGFSGLWCVNLGYGRTELADIASEQMRRLPYATSFFHYSNEPSVALAEKLIQISPPSLKHVFFTLGGSDACDTVIKLVFYYNNLLGRPERKNIISLERGYHGVSYAGAGMTSLETCHRFFDLPLPFQHRIPSHYRYRSPYGVTDADIIAGSVAALEAKVQQLGTETVAAFVCEPIQGSGGVIVPPKGWLKAMEHACNRMNILFVVDEVITGFGRTGTMFASEQEGVSPSIMTLAKGLTSGYLPMGAVLINDEIYRTIADRVPEGTAFAHGFTYSGHIVCSALALAAIDIYEKENLAANSKSVGVYFLERLEQLRSRHPSIGDVRGRGLLAAIELVEDPVEKTGYDLSLNIAGKVRDVAHKNGLLLRAFPGDVLGFAPPLIIGQDGIDEITDKLDATLKEVLGSR